MRNGAVRIEWHDKANYTVNVYDASGTVIDGGIPSWEANWKYKRRYSPAIASMMDNWDSGDPWGSAMSMAWAVAEVGRALDNPVPGQTLNYRPSPLSYSRTIDDLADRVEDDPDIDFETCTLAEAVRDGRVSEDDLVFAAKVLHRYTDILDRAGLSY